MRTRWRWRRSRTPWATPIASSATWTMRRRSSAPRIERIVALEGTDNMPAAVVGNDLAIASPVAGAVRGGRAPHARGAPGLPSNRRSRRPVAGHRHLEPRAGSPPAGSHRRGGGALPGIHRAEAALPRAEAPVLANSLGQLGSLLLEDRKDAGGAEALYREALEIRRAALGTAPPLRGHQPERVGGSSPAEGKLDKAEDMYRQALALRREVLEPGHPFIAYSLVGLAGVLIDLDHATRPSPSCARPSRSAGPRCPPATGSWARP